MKSNAEIAALVESLRCDAVDEKPVHVDWSALRGPDGDGFSVYEAVRCEGCGEVVLLWDGQGGEPHDEVDRDASCEGHVPLSEGPMMNYFYPVEITDKAWAARQIASLPLCVVEFGDGKTGLALTGGGMDLSWEICEAHVLIGFLPPAHFARLDAMADKRYSDRARIVIAACRRSCQVLAGWTQSRIESLDRLEKGLRAEARERRKKSK